MGLFKRISSLFGPRATAGGDPHTYHFAVRCLRCGEVIAGRINLYNDLSLKYGENEAPASYVCRKVLMGTSRCFQPIEVQFIFDTARRVKERQITGGEFVED